MYLAPRDWRVALKIYDATNRRPVDVKWQVPWSNAADCHNRNDILTNRSQVDCGLPSSALSLPGIHAVRSGLWQSAIKFRVFTVAFRATVILFLAIRGLNAADCHNRESPCLKRHIFLPRDF
jgi:hypothetical protein